MATHGEGAQKATDRSIKLAIGWKKYFNSPTSSLIVGLKTLLLLLWLF